MSPIAYLSLGSNLGDRAAYLRRAIALLAEVGVVEAVSSLYETEPWGLRDQPPFLNAACRLTTVLEPEDLLHALQRIEAALGRERLQRWGPRTIDLDIIFYDERVMETAELVIPHPLLAERAFVLVPLAEIAPTLRHPRLGRTVAELLAAVAGRGGVRRYGPPEEVEPPSKRTAMDKVDTAYRRALDYLESFIDYEKGMPHAYSPVSFNLARTADLLAGLGQPHERYPILLIAGTKGKGSTAAFLESILRAAGRRTGLYTSPHLHTWRERIQVDRRLIAKADVAAWMERLRPLVEAMRGSEQGPPTYYEISTALALGYFAEQGIDVAVLEVGLGGRLDATNVVTPRVAILTTIGYDHMEILGHTLAQIAGEKAGIIKPGGWAVSADQEPEALAVIEAACRERGARLWVAAEGGVCPVLPVATEALPYPVPPEGRFLALRGPFQRRNARVAQAAVLALRAQGWDVPTPAIAEGLRNVRWPGRLEVAAARPWIVLDGAHNVDSARALRQALPAEFDYRRLFLVVGFSRGHDVAAFCREIGPAAAGIVLTVSRHPRAAPLADVASEARRVLSVPLETAEGVAAALGRAREMAAPDDLICVCGSLFVVAEAREALGLVGGEDGDTDEHR